MSTEKVKSELQSTAQSQYNAVTDKAEQVEQQAKDLAETALAATPAGQVLGGIESLTSQFDDVKNLIQNTDVAGMLSGETSALDKIKNVIASVTLLNALSTKTDNTIKITWGTAPNGETSLPDSIGIEPDDGEQNLESILNRITGMGEEDPADLKKFLLKGSISGLKGAVDKIQGTISAKGSALDIANAANSFIDDQISNLQEAKASATNYTNVLDLNGDDIYVQVLSTGQNLGAGNESKSPSGDYDARIAELNSLKTDVTTVFSEDQQATINQEGFEKEIQELSDFKESQDLLNSLQNASANQSELTARAEEYRRVISTKLANNSPRGVLEGLNIKLASEIINNIKKIAPTIPDTELNEVIDLSQGDVQDFSRAVIIVSKYSEESYDIIYSTLKSVDSSITTASKPEISEIVFSDPYIVGQSKKDFSYISSVEELEAEFKVMEREVSEMVVHWTETYTNKNIGSEEIEEYHKNLGMNQIGYHLIIRRDGSIQRGRPLGEEGEHTVGRNKYTIGVVFVGGLNCSSGTLNPENFVSAKSLTRSQLNSFDYICSAFYKKIPNGQIVGHKDIDPIEKDPGFDVISYVEAKFLKGSVYKDPSKEGPYSISELNKKRNLR